MCVPLWLAAYRVSTLETLKNLQLGFSVSQSSKLLVKRAIGSRHLCYAAAEMLSTWKHFKKFMFPDFKDVLYLKYFRKFQYFLRFFPVFYSVLFLKNFEIF